MRRATAPIIAAFLLAPLCTPSPAAAKDAHVTAARATKEPGGTWRFEVTVRSNDTGWQKYADRWEVLGPDGRLLGRRVLLHPHETEQPFTRSLSGVRIPVSVERVTIRAHDKMNGYGGRTVTLTLPR